MTRILHFAAGLVLAFPAMSQAVLDPVNGQTVETLVKRALAQNGGLLAGQSQVAAARGGVTQARLKANPSIQVSDAQEAVGSQNTFTIGGTLPLELYHRRERRVEVAEASVRMSEFEQAERERQARAEVESRFGEVLAAARNLQVAKDLLALNKRALDLTQTRADQGAVPPLDANLLRVEVNRMDALRVDLESRLAIALLELKTLAGMKPDEELRISGSLESVPNAGDPPLEQVIAARPDLMAARASELAAAARLRQAETEARPDASVSFNYQRMDSSFNVNGFNAAGQLRPVQGVFHYVAAGVSINLPTRNKNQGAIQTAVAQGQEARRRREYAELIAASEVSAAALARDKALESLRIFRDGVRGQAAQNLEVVRRTYELGRTQPSVPT
ncbi:MAG: TolC family protein [Acidobacteria bacterium]|nr:TolC family protein [Acidobacteriota bacterium]